MDEIKLALLTKAELSAQVARLEGELAEERRIGHGLYLAFHSTQAERDAAIERAEAAEALADEQRALVEELAEHIKGARMLCKNDPSSKIYSSQVKEAVDVLTDALSHIAEAQEK